MKFAVIFCATLLLGLLCGASGQTSKSGKSSDTAIQLEALAKKIDEQNAKIDALSQEILKLEQQIAHMRPGVIIGESTPPPATTSAAVPGSSPHPAGANTHIVARGETLTSIAKLYKVGVEELQNANHIEDGRKLQAGQTIIIPVVSPAASASPSPTE